MRGKLATQNSTDGGSSSIVSSSDISKISNPSSIRDATSVQATEIWLIAGGAGSPGLPSGNPDTGNNTCFAGANAKPAGQIPNLSLSVQTAGACGLGWVGLRGFGPARDRWSGR